MDTSSASMRRVTEVIRHTFAADKTQESVATNRNETHVVAEPSPTQTGNFSTVDYFNNVGARRYKLYVPAGISQAAPLIVMLHGCTQSPDDFATGTRMNSLADEHLFLVMYPEQPSSANPSKCWNWFETQNQQTHEGEPAIIAGMVKEVVAAYAIDPRRVYVAGMSAGAAMAVILGHTYPDLFAAVGAHSGLAYRCASSVPTALAAMRSGRQGRSNSSSPFTKNSAANMQSPDSVRTIVFCGDQDKTVVPLNSVRIVEQAKQRFESLGGQGALKLSKERGQSRDGRAYTLEVYKNSDDTTYIEYWLVDGVSHMWSGGNPNGSYTEQYGPEASAEMVRFFLSVPAKGR